MVNKLVAAAATDAAAEEHGAWFGYCPDGVQTFRIKLARAGTSNPAFMKLQEELLRPYRAGQRDPTNLKIPPHIDRDIQRKLYSRTIVKDWNAEDMGEEFSVENCYNLFASANDVLDWVVRTALASDNYRKVEIAENAGN